MAKTGDIKINLGLDGVSDKPNEDGRERFAANIAPETVNADNRTVDVVWFTGVDVPRYDWRSGTRYIRRFDKKGCDLSYLNNGAPVLDNHDDWQGAKGQMGVVDKAWIDGDLYKGTLRFSKRKEVDGLWQDIQDKIVCKFSMGVEILEEQVTRPDDEPVDGEIRLCTKWRPFEISTAPLPADMGTTTLHAEPAAQPDPVPANNTALNDKCECDCAECQAGNCKECSDPECTDPNCEGESMSGQQPNQQENQSVTKEELEAAAAETARLNTEALAAARKSATDAERARVSAIRLKAKPFNFDEAFVNALIDGGDTIEMASDKIIAEYAKRSEKNPQTPANGGATEVTADERDKVREGMAAAVLYRAEPQKFAAMRDKRGEFAHLNLPRMAEESLRRVGINTNHMSTAEMVRVALLDPYKFQSERFVGAQGVSDFPNILANIATKSLRSAYEAAPPTFLSIARRVTAPDFKQAKSVNVSDISSLRPVQANGEFNRTKITDSGETYQVGSYGEIVSINRQVIINDDLNALVRVPAALGQAASRMESDVFWAVVTGNANMSDGVAIFAAGHNNYLTGGTSAVGLAGLGAGKAKMRLQTAPQGTILNYTPVAIVGPAAQEQAILQLVNPMQLAAPATTAVVPQWVTLLKPVIEPRLDAVSTTAWYLVADGDGFIYCYLEGQEGVYTETRQGFDVDGVEIKARVDFGAAVVEFRAWQLNAGV